MITTSMATPAAAATTTIMTTITSTTTTTTITSMAMATATSMAEAPLPLFVWLSPAFPVGAFAYSHGLEWAVETGAVRDAATLQAWIADLLEHGSGRNDAVLLAASFRATRDGDDTALAEVAELAVALQPSAERHLEATAQGNAFIAAARAAWPCPAFDRLARAWDGDVAYPVALGVAAAGHGIGLAQTLETALLAFVANLVSAALRLGAIGQTDGQRVTAALLPAVRAAAGFAAASTLDDIGGAAFRSDIASLRHETQYTRLFRS
jgi:urease accessory protein